LFKRVVVAVAATLLLAAAGFASAQQAQQKAAEYTPPPGVEMQINLYPITKFRGNAVVLTESTPRLRLPITVESIVLTRGIWELCGNINYLPPCTRIDSTRTGIPVAIITRSARLIGDTGPLFTEAPVTRAGPDVPILPSGEVVESRPAPAPVVAPTVAAGGEPGTNPSLAGNEVEFFPAPAKAGVRVLACAQGNATPRCVQASADGFCAEAGYRDSGWREMIEVNGKAYLSNVLCKRAADSEGARDRRGLGGLLPKLP